MFLCVCIFPVLISIVFNHRKLQLENGKFDLTFTRKELIDMIGAHKCTSVACNANDPNVHDYARMRSLLVYVEFVLLIKMFNEVQKFCNL